MTIKMNPDLDQCKIIQDSIKANDGYCPCALEKNEDTLCLCKYFRDLEAGQWCHCGLYYKIQK